MLTDVFVVRYANIEVAPVYGIAERKMLHQCFNVLEEIHPFFEQETKSKNRDGKFWQNAHNAIANELGCRWLSRPYRDTALDEMSFRSNGQRQRAYIEICRDWIGAEKTSAISDDEFVKNRLSLIEYGLREIQNSIAAETIFLKDHAEYEEFLGKHISERKSEYERISSEVNKRFQQAGIRLNYHNGFIQIERDSLVASEIETSFWDRVSEKKWVNVDTDMKEAIDQRDSGGKDPAFYAARALESAIKIISDELRVSHGSERGAHGFIDNISKSSVGFLDRWEAEILKDFFSKVRNPLGHGPGKGAMATLKSEQTDWAIEAAMSWIKLLVTRHSRSQVAVATP